MKKNIDFSLQRIGWLLRKDWIEHKKSSAYAVGTFLIVVFPFLWLNTKITGISENKQAAIYILGALGCFLYYCRFVGKKIHFSKGLYLTLPASTSEKYGTLLLEGLFLFALFNLLYWGSLHLWSAMYPAVVPIDPSTLYSRKPASGLLLFAASLVFLSYLSFKKYALGIALAGMAATIGLLIGIVALVVRSQMETPFDLADSVWINPNALASTMDFIKENVRIAMGISTLVVLYIGYLKLKEKESR